MKGERGMKGEREGYEGRRMKGDREMAEGRERERTSVCVLLQDDQIILLETDQCTETPPPGGGREGEAVFYAQSRERERELMCYFYYCF